MRRLLLPAVLIAVLLCACAQETTLHMQDGYYTAEAAHFDEHGWKDFITIYVSNNKIITAEYNSKNASGFIKSWDMNYMRIMDVIAGTYPNKYSRAYAADLINKQDPGRIDAISGATDSYHSIRLLAQAAIAQAKAGDKNIVFIELQAE